MHDVDSVPWYRCRTIGERRLPIFYFAAKFVAQLAKTTKLLRSFPVFPVTETTVILHTRI